MSDLIAHIDAEIAMLQQVKATLTGGTTSVAASAPAPAPAVKSGRGRPKGSKNAAKTEVAPKPAKKRSLSPEGRKAIAEAMKRRWAERRKQAPK
jgi:hypothetical protein